MWTWPTQVQAVQPGGRIVTLRPLRRDDRGAWESMRSRNADWLRPWESTLPGAAQTAPPFGRLRRSYDRAAREGRLVPFVIDTDGKPVGQMHLFEIQWGSRWSASAGYWLDRSATGQGLATWALAMAIDHGLTDVGLHRVEVNVRPDNASSLAVVRRLSLPQEGLRRGLIHVDGGWRDHLTFAMTADDPEAGALVSRLRQASQPSAEGGEGVKPHQ